MQTIRTGVIAAVVAALLWGVAGAAPDGDSRPGNSPNGPLASQESQDPFQLNDCIIDAVKVEVPAEEAGRLVEIKVQDGQEVKAGERIAQIDDSMSQASLKAANAKVLASKVEAEEDIEWEDKVKIRHARASQQVAETELDRYRAANKQAAGTYTALQLLEAQFKVVAAKLAVQNAGHEYKIAAQKVFVQQAEEAAAEIDLGRRKVVAPLDGVVRKRFREQGEWVKPGDTVVAMFRMDRLRINAFLDARFISRGDVDQQPVVATVVLPGGREETFHGRIAWVDPSIGQDAKFQVRAELENRRDELGHWKLVPGLAARMKIQPRGKR